MEFENLVCKNCGGSDFHKLSDLEYRCNHCSGLLVRSPNALPARPYVAEPIPVEETPPIFVKAAGALIVAVFVFVIIVALLPKKEANVRPGTPTPGARQYKVPTPPPALKATMDVEVLGKVKGSFDSVYIKCMVTNTGQTVITEPSVSLALYKGDTKLDTVYGDAPLKYLLPGAKTPVWIDLLDHEDYTTAKVQENNNLRGIENAAGLFPQLKIPDAAMKIEKGTSSYNDRLYTEKFYDVTGTVTNDVRDGFKPELYVIYYDSKSQVVGVKNASPPVLGKGEKGKFDVSAGETELFGAPSRFEILVVDPEFKKTPCAANKIC